MVRISVIGATGYAGQELVRLIVGHPDADLVGVGSNTYAGIGFSEVYPHFRGQVDMKCCDTYDIELIKKADIIFLSLPHGLSVPLVENILREGKQVIDLGADFRLTSPETYSKWYEKQGPTVEMLAKAVYGLPEINRKEVVGASIVANPGCYPTTVLLGLAPLLKAQEADTNSIIIDSKSGVSGAGRGLKTTSLYSEVNEGFKAYGFPRHRHTPEIEQELSKLANKEVTISFTPHLVPMTRGMLSTIYVSTKNIMGSATLYELYKNFYQNEQFVRILPSGQYPNTKWVAGTNYCDIGLHWDERTGRAVIVSVIDNLVKGAAGQAVQNMNILLGIEENTGLKGMVIYP